MNSPSTSLPQGRHTELRQGSDAWLAVRKGVVTGSRVAGILGHNPYSSYEKVMDEMLRQHHGLEPRFKGNTATEWGNAHEEDARISFEAQYGTVVNETGFHFHPDYDYIGASPDGLIFGDGLEAVTEFKCPYSGKIPEHPPLHYVDQCQMVMWVMDVTVCSLYYWTEDESKSFTIYVDTDWQDATLPVINDFIDDFNKRKQEEYVDFIEVTDTEAITEANILADLRANIRELQDQEKELSAKLKEYADEKHDTIIGCMKVTHVTRKGNINAKRILKDTGIDIELYRNKPITVTMIKEMK